MCACFFAAVYNADGQAAAGDTRDGRPASGAARPRRHHEPAQHPAVGLRGPAEGGRVAEHAQRDAGVGRAVGGAGAPAAVRPRELVRRLQQSAAQLLEASLHVNPYALLVYRIFIMINVFVLYYSSS